MILSMNACLNIQAPTSNIQRSPKLQPPRTKPISSTPPIHVRLQFPLTPALSPSLREDATARQAGRGRIVGSLSAHPRFRGSTRELFWQILSPALFPSAAGGGQERRQS